MGNTLLRSKPNNILTIDGNQVALFISPEGVLMGMDFRGVTEPISNYIGGGPGPGDYIQNQYAVNQAANFRISGQAAIGDFGGASILQALNVKGRIQLLDTADTGNVAIGQEPLANITSGFNNVGIGNYALYLNGDGAYNIAIGAALLSNISGRNNVAVGDNALLNTLTDSNIGIGKNAARLNNTGTNNIAIGYRALDLNQPGSQNIAIGNDALRLNINSIGNIAIGYQAMGSANGSSNNIAIGNSVLNTNDGTNNIVIGQSSVNAATALNNSIILSNFFPDSVFTDFIAIGQNCAAPGANGDFILGSLTTPVGKLQIETIVSTRTWEVTLNGVKHKFLLA